MKKLLIVDDDTAMRTMMRVRLSDTYEIFDTEDPEQAIALALQHKPDAVLLDLMMPKFSGMELCQSFHSLTYTSYLPIFVITARPLGASIKTNVTNWAQPIILRSP